MFRPEHICEVYPHAPRKWVSHHSWVDTALADSLNGQGRGNRARRTSGVSAKQQSKKIVGITPPTGRLLTLKTDSSLVPDTSVRQRSRRARRTEASSLRPIVIL